MARTKTTTPTNKNDTAAKAKPSKAKKPKTTVLDTDGSAPSDSLTSTIGEQLAAKGVEVPAHVNEVEITHEKRPLFCPITKEQALERTDRAWILKDLIAKEEAATKKIVDASKQKIKAYESDIEQLEKEVHDRGLTVDVDCKVEKNYRLKQYVVTREDTNELVEERAFSAFETQMALNYGQPTEVVKPRAVTKKKKSDDSGIVDDNYTGNHDESDSMDVPWDESAEEGDPS